MLFVRFFIILCCLLRFVSASAVEVQTENGAQCSETFEKDRLLNGWYLWEPYQFNKVTAGGYSLTGMDIELVKHLAQKVGVVIEYGAVDCKM